MHIPREQNAWADELCHVAMRKKEAGSIHNLDITMIDNVKEVSDQVFITKHQNNSRQPVEVCKICKTITEELQCWGCNRFYHKKCIKATEYPQRRGPWHCKNCKQWFGLIGTRDITLDETLLKYLSHGELSDTTATNARILKTANYVNMDN